MRPVPVVPPIPYILRTGMWLSLANPSKQSGSIPFPWVGGQSPHDGSEREGYETTTRIRVYPHVSIKQLFYFFSIDLRDRFVVMGKVVAHHYLQAIHRDDMLRLSETRLHQEAKHN